MSQTLRERPRVVVAAILAVVLLFAVSMLIGVAIGGDSGSGAAVGVGRADANAQRLLQEVEAAEQRIAELEGELNLARERARRRTGRAGRLARRGDQLERRGGQLSGGRRGHSR